MRNKKIDDVQPLVIKGQKNFYTNLDHSLRAKDFTRANYSQTEKEVWDHYANIVFTHQASKTGSILMSNFLRKNTDGKKLLERMDKENHIPLHILEQFYLVMINMILVMHNCSVLLMMQRHCKKNLMRCLLRRKVF